MINRIRQLVNTLYASRRGFAVCIVPVTVIIAVTVALMLYDILNNRAAWREDFRRSSGDRVEGIQREYDISFAHQAGINALFSASGHVSENEFQDYIDTLSAMEEPLYAALEWVPRVSHADRAGFEERSRAYRPDFRIWEFDAEGRPRHARVRPEYFPVSYVHSPDGDFSVRGFDLASEPVRRRALEAAASTGRLAVTAPLKLIQGYDSNYGYLVFIPVYRDGRIPSSERERLDRIAGFSVGVYVFGTILEHHLSHIQRANQHIYVFTDANPDSSPVYVHTAGSRNELIPLPSNAPVYGQVAGSDYAHVAHARLAGARITYVFIPGNRVGWWSWVDSGSVIIFAGGLCMAALTLFYISRRARTGELIRESEERYRNLIENSHDLIQSVDPEGRIVFVNRTWRRVMEYEEEDLASLRLSDIIHADSHDHCHDMYRRIITGGRVENLSAVFVTKSGRMIDVEGSAILQTSALAPPVTNAFFMDVTERRRVEYIRALRLATSTTLARSADLRKTLAEILASIGREAGWICGELWWLYPGGEALVPRLNWKREESGALEEFFGASAGRMFEYNSGLPGLTWSGGRPLWIGDLASEPAFLRRELAARAGLRSAVSIPLADREELYGVMLFFGALRRPVEDDLLAVFAEIGLQIGQFITRKNLEAELYAERERLARRVDERTAELMDATRRAEAANRAKSEFLASMSHELRTPLNSIIGYAEVILNGMAGELTDEQAEYLGDISESGRHLLSLINDILDLSKVEAGRMELNRSVVSLKSVLASTLSLFGEKALNHGISLKAENRVGDDDDLFVADGRKVKQVLYNLVSNAVKFTPDGGSVYLTASIDSTGDRPLYQFTVRDTGIGIPVDKQELLFRPFTQIDGSSTRQYAGTGLGLSISRAFIELHGGRIWMESVPREGSAFHFTIPYERAESRVETAID